MMDRDARLKAILNGLSQETQAIRVGMDRTHEREHSEPIYTTSSFVFPYAETMCDAFTNYSGLSIYARVDNPTVDGFCKRLAVLEGAESCVASASGMGAILSLVMAHCKLGDRILVSTGVFGATITLFQNYFAKLGILIELIPTTNLDAWEKALNTPAVLVGRSLPSARTCTQSRFVRLDCGVSGVQHLALCLVGCARRTSPPRTTPVSGVFSPISAPRLVG